MARGCDLPKTGVRGSVSVREVIRIPKPLSHPLRRLVVKQFLRRPVQIYNSEARRIASEIEHLGGRVLHIYFGHIAVQLLPLMRIATVPVVVSFHGADVMIDMNRPAYLAATQEMLQRAKLVLVRSNSLAEQVKALGCNPAKIRIHRTGIPLERFHFIPREAPANGQWMFFQACRLIQKKGLQTSLRAFAEFAKHYPKATFTIAGDGPLLEELGFLTDELKISDRVIFAGFLSQNALREQLYAAHLFLHPSELGNDGNQEGVPNSMLEAMSTGLPVLATEHGGIPEAVDNGVSGFLVRERDYEMLAKRMLELAQNPALFAAMGRAASEAVAERFEQGKQIEVLESYYREAAEM